MDNKLSELSKPVVWVPKSQLAMVNSGDAVLVEADLCAVQRFNEDPLYSQEYVSALTQRIAELESIRADASQVFKEIGNELGCNPDNESIMMAIDALKEREKRVVALAGGSAELWETMAARLEAAEAKLATPVRLPTTSGRLGVAYTRVIPEVIEAIRAAGFTVEGDE